MPYLMERLENRTDRATGQSLPFDLVAAVGAQLQRIVACRPDMGARSVQLNDFGMPSIVDQGPGRRDLENYAERLARAIARYEPRLREVRLEWVGGGASSPRTLVVNGRLVGTSEPRAFRFDLPAAGAAHG